MWESVVVLVLGRETGDLSYPFPKGTAQSFLSWKIKLFTSDESKARN